jgi:hypothetical protein
VGSDFPEAADFNPFTSLEKIFLTTPLPNGGLCNSKASSEERVKPGRGLLLLKRERFYADCLHMPLTGGSRCYAVALTHRQQSLKTQNPTRCTEFLRRITNGKKRS